MNTVFLGLGTNLGEKEKNLLKAYELIGENIGGIKKKSSLYFSEAWGFESKHSFINSVIQVETKLKPHLLLGELQKIEKNIGKTKHTKNQDYLDRIIDIDILFYNDEIIECKQLSIPHPLINKRLFVLEPMNEIAGNLRHPQLNLPIKKILLEAIKNKTEKY